MMKILNMTDLKVSDSLYQDVTADPDIVNSVICGEFHKYFKDILAITVEPGKITKAMEMAKTIILHPYIDPEINVITSFITSCNNKLCKKIDLKVTHSLLSHIPSHRNPEQCMSLYSAMSEILGAMELHEKLDEIIYMWDNDVVCVNKERCVGKSKAFRITHLGEVSRMKEHDYNYNNRKS